MKKTVSKTHYLLSRRESRITRERCLPMAPAEPLLLLRLRCISVHEAEKSFVWRYIATCRSTDQKCKALWRMFPLPPGPGEAEALSWARSCNLRSKELRFQGIGTLGKAPPGGGRRRGGRRGRKQQEQELHTHPQHHAPARVRWLALMFS